jgi:hypothetical protein
VPFSIFEWVKQLLRENPITLVWIFFLAIALPLKLLFDYLNQRSAEKNVIEAETEAFVRLPESFAEDEARTDSGEPPPQVFRFVPKSEKALQMGRLFKLYSKQVEKYHPQTQARVWWSFIFAIMQ